MKHCTLDANQNTLASIDGRTIDHERVARELVVCVLVRGWEDDGDGRIGCDVASRRRAHAGAVQMTVLKLDLNRDHVSTIVRQ